MAKRGRGTRANGEGSLLKRKGCKLWYAQYYKDGRQIRTSTGTAMKAEALGVLRRLMGDSERGLLAISDVKKITYGNLRAALIANYQEKGNRTLYQTADGEETIGGLKALDAFYGFADGNPGKPVTQITTDSARAFARQQQDARYSPATINRSLACLRRMLRIAYEDSKIQTVPKVRLLKEPPARKGFLTIQKFQELLAKLPTNLQPLVLFLYWCGVRLGEALQIEWPQVELNGPQGSYIRLEEDQTTNEEARIVPLPPVLVEILSSTEPKVGRVFVATNLRVEWARACVAVGLGQTTKMPPKTEGGHVWTHYNGLIVHDLRRSAVRNLVNAGVPERVAMKISGHKTRSVFDRYHVVSTEDVAAAMSRVVAASLQPGQPTERKPPKSLSANLVQTGQRSTRKLLRARSSNG
jgi:integrase